MGVRRNGKNLAEVISAYSSESNELTFPFRIRHFDRKRTFEQFKKRMDKGFDPLTKEEETKYGGEEKKQSSGK